MKRYNMKKMRKDPDMLEEYDFSKGVRRKYAKRYSEGTNIVVIEQLSADPNYLTNDSDVEMVLL